MRVMTTPQGTGAPTNLWPLTLTEPMGFLNVTIGAAFTKGIYSAWQHAAELAFNRSTLQDSVCSSSG